MCQVDSPESPKPLEASKDSCLTKDSSDAKFSDTPTPTPSKEAMALDKDPKVSSKGKLQQLKDTPPAKRGRGRPKRAAMEVPSPAAPALPATAGEHGTVPQKETASIASNAASLSADTAGKQGTGPQKEAASIASNAASLAAGTSPAPAKEATGNVHHEVAVGPASMTSPGTSAPPRTRGRKSNPGEKPRARTRKQKALSSTSVGAEVNMGTGCQSGLDMASEKTMVTAIAQEKPNVNISSGSLNVATSAYDDASAGSEKPTEKKDDISQGEPKNDGTSRSSRKAVRGVDATLSGKQSTAVKYIGTSPLSAQGVILDTKLNSDVTQKPSGSQTDISVQSTQETATINVQPHEMQKPSNKPCGSSLQGMSVALSGSEVLLSPVSNSGSENLMNVHLLKSVGSITLQEDKAPASTSEQMKSETLPIASALTQLQCCPPQDGNVVPVVINREPDNRASVTRKKAAAREPKNRSSSSTAACERRARLAGLKQAEGLKKRDSKGRTAKGVALRNEQLCGSMIIGAASSELGHNLEEKIPNIQIITNLKQGNQEDPILPSKTTLSMEAVSFVSQVIDTHKKMVSDDEEKAAVGSNIQFDAAQIEEPSTVLRTTESIKATPRSSCLENPNTHVNDARSSIHEEPSTMETQENIGSNPTCSGEFSAEPATGDGHEDGTHDATTIKQDDNDGDSTRLGVSLASSHTGNPDGRVVEKSEVFVKLFFEAPIENEAVEKTSIPTCSVSESLSDTDQCSKSESSYIRGNTSGMDNICEASLTTTKIVDSCPDPVKSLDIPDGTSVMENVCKASSTDAPVSTSNAGNVCNSLETGHSDVSTLPAFTSKQDDDSGARICNEDSAPPVVPNQVISSKMTMDPDVGSKSTASTDLDEEMNGEHPPEGLVVITGTVPDTTEHTVQLSNSESMVAEESQLVEADAAEDTVPRSSSEEVNDSRLQASTDRAEDTIHMSSSKEVDSELQPSSEDAINYINKEYVQAGRVNNIETKESNLQALAKDTIGNNNEEDVQAGQAEHTETKESNSQDLWDDTISNTNKEDVLVGQGENTEESKPLSLSEDAVSIINKEGAQAGQGEKKESKSQALSEDTVSHTNTDDAQAVQRENSKTQTKDVSPL